MGFRARRIAANSQTLVFYAWDGEIAYVDDAQLQLISKDFQELYNSKPFNGFRAAAVEGTKKTERLALGKTYPMVCIGRSYEDSMKVGKPFEPEESDYGKQSQQEKERIVYAKPRRKDRMPVITIRMPLTSAMNWRLRVSSQGFGSKRCPLSATPVR